MLKGKILPEEASHAAETLLETEEATPPAQKE